MAETYQKVFRGRGSIGKILQMTEKLGIARPMIIGAERLAGKLLKKAPALLAAPVFSEYHPNPDLPDALPAVKIFREQGCDGIISIGGGSAMDTAKAVKALLFAESPEAALAGKFPDRMDIPHIAVPGTAGTGAEVTPNAIVAVPEKELKVGIVNENMIADYVILDARMIKNLPRSIAAATGVDALAHCIECYTSNKANPFSDM